MNVGMQATALDYSPAFEPYSGVRLWYDDENCFFAGDETGRVMEADCPWATQTMADNILASIVGYTYQPFEAKTALLDPVAELGDAVRVDNIMGILGGIKTDFDAMCSSEIFAPADEEIDHEYPYLTKQERTLNRKVTLGATYFGTKITRENGLEIVKTGADGSETNRVLLNSDVLAFYDNNGNEALYFDAVEGTYKFKGTLNVSDRFVVDAEGNMALYDNWGREALSFDADEGAYKFSGTLNISDNFVVDAYGNVTINGKINLSGGAITWGDNDPSDGQLTEDDVRTYIDDQLVSSPKIAGGKFLDMEQDNWVEMGAAELGSNAVAYFNHFFSGYSSSEPLFVMGYMSSAGAHGWVMAPFNDVVLNYVKSSETTYALGNWDFSHATVTGLN